MQGTLATPRCPTLTFLSGVSANCQLLAFRWYSSSNFMLMSSMDNCRRSQNPARSWAVGLGLALGFYQGKYKSMLEYTFLTSRAVCTGYIYTPFKPYSCPMTETSRTHKRHQPEEDRGTWPSFTVKNIFVANRRQKSWWHFSFRSLKCNPEKAL